ncbi:MAG: glycosyltransferase family 4 protein [Dehalococcoidia bacterium]|nr:glycosyltransferase family 4 protein [Dehalococcoidia bacterium]MDW8119901.1 glycosyltransferase family 4 protein [Chloroflexota bacterium]
MRVLFISNDFPPKPGGGAMAAYGLARGLHQIGVEVWVLTTAPPRGHTDAEGFPLTRTAPRWDKKGVKILPLTLASLGICRRWHPHRLLALSWTHDGVAALIIRRLRGIPYLVMAHGTEILRHRRGPLHPLMLRVFRNAIAVAANSTFTHRLVVSLGIPAEHVYVVHPPIVSTNPPEPDSRLVDEKFNLRGKRVLLTVARLVKRKGHAQVLEALRALKDRYPDLVYVITGDGEYRAELQRLVSQYGLEEQVRFIGFIPREEVWQLYQRAEIYISPSLEDKGDVEGFGISFVEAGLCGKPVIAGRSGGVADVVRDGETGLLVDAHNPGEIIRALTLLLDNPALRERLGQRGRERALQEFTPEAQAQKMLKVLEDAVARKV